jgi:hypothetical protein
MGLWAILAGAVLIRHLLRRVVRAWRGDGSGGERVVVERVD